MSLYFILLLSSVAVPLLLSFDKRLQFYRMWKYILPGIIIVAAVYIAFDVYLTKQGVWGFNPRYLSGIYIFHLPIEEWLFFIVIAYASLFLHYSIVEYFPKVRLTTNAARILTILFIVLSLVLIFVYINKMYTTYIFAKLAVVLLLSLIFDKSETIRSFFITFLVILVPFVIVNGILTGSFIEEQVVWYNNNENLGIRFFTIPIEDFAYAFSLIFLSLIIVERSKK